MRNISTESDIIRLLEVACVDTNDRIQIYYSLSNGHIVDAYTETGVKQLEILPNTIVEIKNRLLPDTLYQLLQLRRTLTNTENILIILKNGEAPEENYGIEIKTIKELQKLSKKIAPKISSSSSDYSVIDEARANFHKGQNALVLGAGVSKNAGLPLWDELLEAIFYSIKSKNDVDNFDALSRPCGYSSIIKAQYLSKLQSSPKKLSVIIKKVLGNYKHSINNSLFRALVYMIKTKRVSEVLTFNYDDLLEDALDLFFDTPNNYSVVYDNNYEPNDKMPIYHLHGYVPINEERNSIQPTPIISEEDYHQLYKQSFHWSNVTLLHALNTKTCFFIGLSMLDPNMRRILDFYSDERKNGKNQFNHQHYAFMRKEALEHASQKQNRKHWRTMEQIYKRWNIKVIWFEDFQELPNILNTIVSKSC